MIAYVENSVRPETWAHDTGAAGAWFIRTAVNVQMG